MITLSEAEIKTKIRSLMCSYDTYFRDMETMFDAGYCKGVLDTIFLMLNILGVQCTKEFILNQQRSA